MSKLSAPLTVLLANPRGFCAGVERAIDIVDQALKVHGAPVYVRHEIVHNKRVVEALQAKGAVFVSEVDAVPVGAVIVFSAHGVSRAVESAAGERSLQVIDATCPLVTRVHSTGARYARRGYDVVLIGHRGHPEVLGTLGQIQGTVHLVETLADVDELCVSDADRVAYITQTTLSMRDAESIINALKRRFPSIEGPHTDEICYATQNRQNAVESLAGQIDLLLVVGASNSSNSNRLKELGRQLGIQSYLIEDATHLNTDWLEGVSRVGLTAGASAPEDLVQEVIERLRALRDVRLDEPAGVVESVRFRMPEIIAVQ